MTRQHFQVIAQAIKTLPTQEVTKYEVAKHFARTLAETNPNWKEQKFMEACGFREKSSNT